LIGASANTTWGNRARPTASDRRESTFIQKLLYQN
jgi:hypothetical protein